MALWAGKGKTLAAIMIIKNKCFNGLKRYREWKKHSKVVLNHQTNNFKQELKRKVFLAWEKDYKVWKIKKTKEDFDKSVK